MAKESLSNTFQFRAIDGKISVGSEYNRIRLSERLKKGGRGHIIFEIPESRGQRRFFEGAVTPLATYFQDNLDYRDRQDILIMRDELAREFVGEETVKIKGKVRSYPRSTKGSKVLNKLLEDSIDWLVAEYGIDQMEVLNPDKYKHWRDAIFPYGGADNYIDYLIETGRLKKKY